VELSEILARFAEGVPAIDGATNIKHLKYLQGVPTLTENQLADEFVAWWTKAYPNDFLSTSNWEREMAYPENGRAKCDIVFTSKSFNGSKPEWAIELKCIRFIGDNGKNNDFALSKFFSPYLKDRSLIHDIERLNGSSIARRKAVIGYGWNYSFASCKTALEYHPNETERIQNIRNVCHRNDPINGILDLIPILEMVNHWLTSHNLTNQIIKLDFEDAWRHPTGGSGSVFGWELT